jgi:hypothetical protein
MVLHLLTLQNPLYFVVFFLKKELLGDFRRLFFPELSFIDLDKEQLLNAVRLEPIPDFCVLKVHL